MNVDLFSNVAVFILETVVTERMKGDVVVDFDVWELSFQLIEDAVFGSVDSFVAPFNDVTSSDFKQVTGRKDRNENDDTKHLVVQDSFTDALEESIGNVVFGMDGSRIARADKVLIFDVNEVLSILNGIYVSFVDAGFGWNPS